MVRTSSARRLVVGALATALLSLVPLGASAQTSCWCRTNQLAERIAKAEQVFKFRVDELEVMDPVNAVAYGEVVEAFKGGVEQRVRVGLELRKTCFDARELQPGTVIGVIGSKGKYKANGACDEAATDAAVELVMDPIEQPERGEGHPAVLVNNGTLGARLAVVDDQMNLAYLGPGLGKLREIAVCPGGRVSIEIVAPRHRGRRLTAETRDLETLQIGEVTKLDWRVKQVSAVRDLQCHDAAGTVYSYLLFNTSGDDGQRGSIVEIRRGGEITQLPVSFASHAVVDLEAGFAYAMIGNFGEPNPRVERWSVEEAKFDRAFELPGMLFLADMALDQDSGEVFVLGTTEVRDQKKKHGKGRLVRIASDEATVTEIRNAMRPVEIEVVDNRIYTVVKIRGKDDLYQVRNRRGRVLEEIAVGRTTAFAVVAAGDMVVYRSGSQLRRHDEPAAQQPFEGLRLGPVAAITDRETLEIAVGDLPPLVERDGSIIAGGPTPPGLRPQSEPAPSRVPWLLAAFAMLGLGAVTLLGTRRRRAVPEDDGWMAHTRDEGPAGPS